MGSVSYSILKPLIMSFCTQGLPGVAESTVSISEGCPSSRGEGARQGGLGVRKSVFVWLSTIVFDGPLSPRGRGLFWMMDSATSPFGSAQNDRVGIGMSESFRIRETKLKGVKYFKIIH